MDTDYQCCHGPVRGKRAKDDPEIAMVNALDTLRIAA